MLDTISRFADSLHDAVDDVVLFGMGGSSLAPEVLRQTFDVDWFHVLDTTHPKAIRAARGADRPRPDSVRRLVEVGHDARNAVAARALLGEDRRQAPRPLRGDHRSRLRPREPSRGSGVRRGLLRRAVDRRALLGALAVRDRAGGADGYRRRGAARARAADARGVPLRQRQPRLRARPRVRRGLERRPRQDLHRRHAGRLRPVGRAADRGVDRQARQGARPRARRVARRPRPPGGDARDPRPARARRRVLPLGVRGRGRRRVSRDQSVRPARRPGGEGQDERGARDRHRAGARARELGRGAAREGAGGRLHLRAGVRRPRDRPHRRSSAGSAARAAWS